jgi:hypothetical protein
LVIFYEKLSVFPCFFRLVGFFLSVSFRNSNIGLFAYHVLMQLFRVPLVVEANKIGDVSVVDATIIEENCATSSLFVGIMPPECDYNPVYIILLPLTMPKFP